MLAARNETKSGRSAGHHLVRGVAAAWVRSPKAAQARPRFRPSSGSRCTALISGCAFGVAGLKNACKCEFDESFQYVTTERSARQEHAQVDRRKDHLNEQIGVGIGTQDSFAYPPLNQLPTDIAPFSPEALDRRSNLRGLVDRSHEALQHRLPMVGHQLGSHPLAEPFQVAPNGPCVWDRLVTVATAIQGVGDQFVTRRPASVDSGLGDPRPQSHSLDAEAVIAFCPQLGKGGIEHRPPDAGTSSPRSAPRFVGALCTHPRDLIATPVAFTHRLM
jgi:hypothetical protein